MKCRSCCRLALCLALAWLIVGVSSAQEPRLFDPEAATKAYLGRIADEVRERSDAYFEGGYWLQLIGYLYGLVVAWILLAGKISARMRDWAEKWRGRGVVGSASRSLPREDRRHGGATPAGPRIP